MALRSRFAFVLNHLAELAQPTRPQRDEMAVGSSSTSSSAPPPSWVILGSIPRVFSTELPRGADHSLALEPPPRITLLDIARRLFPDGVITDLNHPFISAVEPSSGLLLLHSDQGSSRRPTVIDRPDRQAFFWTKTIPGYFVLDTASGSSRALPEPELIMNTRNVGILASPTSNAHYVVVEFQPVFGSILCYSSSTRGWEYKSAPKLPRSLAPNGVVAHKGKLWWVDLDVGLAVHSPFTSDAPVLTFVPLPPGMTVESGTHWMVLDRQRLVRVSAGRLRLVDMSKTHDDHSCAKVALWTMVGDEEPEDSAVNWTLEREVSFADIWAHPSYKATGLPNKIPVLALLHPQQPYIVYFFLEENLFSVDIRDGSLVECSEYKLVAPPKDHLAARFVHAWELPPALASSSG